MTNAAPAAASASKIYKFRFPAWRAALSKRIGFFLAFLPMGDSLFS